MKILNLGTPPRQTLAFHIIPGGGERLFHSEASETTALSQLTCLFKKNGKNVRGLIKIDRLPAVVPADSVCRGVRGLPSGSSLNTACPTAPTEPGRRRR